MGPSPSLNGVNSAVNLLLLFMIGGHMVALDRDALPRCFSPEVTFSSLVVGSNDIRLSFSLF